MSDSYQPPSLPVSVVVRSYHRRESMLALVRALLSQDYPSFEVVVMEQSEWSLEERAPLDQLAASDSRLRVLYSKPLGVGGARNAGWKAARYDIVLTIDDDDLPIGDQFIRGHADNYADPRVVAVTGRHVYSVTERCGYKRRARARRLCLRYNFFGYPHVFCRFDERIDSVDWVHGSNGSVQRALIERVGGWDDHAMAHDEHAFCLQLRHKLEPGERLVFDPAMVLLRNKDLPGGAAVRWAGPRVTFQDWHRYFHGLVLRHRPVRSALLYPIFPLACWFLAVRWIWTDARIYPTIAAKLLTSAHAFVSGPYWYLAELLRRPDSHPRGALPAHQRR
jgi:glycosyltransferase involved in cell wall biosynthesis